MRGDADELARLHEPVLVDVVPLERRAGRHRPRVETRTAERRDAAGDMKVLQRQIVEAEAEEDSLRVVWVLEDERRGLAERLAVLCRDGPPEETQRAGEAQSQIWLPRKECSRRLRPLHEPPRPWRLDELVTQGCVEETQGADEDGRLAPVRPVLEGCFSLPQIHLRAAGGVGVELEGHRRVFPLAGQRHAGAAYGKAILIERLPVLVELVLRVLVVLVLGLEIGRRGDPLGRENPGPEALVTERLGRGR